MNAVRRIILEVPDHFDTTSAEVSFETGGWDEFATEVGQHVTRVTAEEVDYEDED